MNCENMWSKHCSTVSYQGIWNNQKKKKRKAITSGVNSREDALVEGTGSKIPDLVGVRKQTLAHEFGSIGREPNQMHLLNSTFQFDSIIQIHWFYLKEFDEGEEGRQTSFSSLRLRVPVMKLVWSVSALTSDIHLAWPIVRMGIGIGIIRVYEFGGKESKSREMRITWYFRPYPMPDDPPCIAICCSTAWNWNYDLCFADCNYLLHTNCMIQPPVLTSLNLRFFFSFHFRFWANVVKRAVQAHLKMLRILYPKQKDY